MGKLWSSDNSSCDQLFWLHFNPLKCVYKERCPLIVIALCLLILDLSQKFKLKWGLIWLILGKNAAGSYLSCRGQSLTKNKYVYNISLAEMLCTMLHASY